MSSSLRSVGIAIITLIICVGVFSPILTHAQTPVSPVKAGAICDAWYGAPLCYIAATFAYVLPVTLSSWILWLSGVFLNTILDYTVVDLKSSLDKINGINVAWKTIRDLANISFIFILLYAAINTILEREKDWQKIVKNIVIAAILINFSLFMTKLIIDASNIVALTFYQQMVPNASATTGLSNYYTQPLGLGSFFSPAQTAQDLVNGYDLGKMFIMGIGTTVFFLITSFVFFAVSLLFLVRYVNIIFLLVLSPLALLGSVFSSGSLQTNIKKWWSTLFSQMIFAPAYMIMTWVVITILNSPGFQGNSGGGAGAATFSGLFNNEISAFGLVMNFLIVIALAIGTLITAKSIASQGGSAAQKLVGGALGFGVSAAGFAGRNTAGRLGSRLTRSTQLKDAANQGGAKGYVARMALKTSNSASKGSFDLRSSRAVTELDKIGQSSGMGGFKDYGFDTKGGGKGGIQKWKDDRTKALQKKFEDQAKMLGASSEAEKEQLKNRRKNEEDALKNELRRIESDPSIGTVQKERIRKSEAEISELKKREGEKELLISSTTSPLSDSDKEIAKKERDEIRASISAKNADVEKAKNEISELLKKAKESTNTRLEEIGVVNEDTLNEFTDKNKKDEYKKSTEVIKKDLESGQNRVKNQAERIASSWNLKTSLFSADEARRKALASIKKGGEKKPEEILKEAIEKEAKKVADEERSKSSDSDASSVAKKS